jgi:hypothetical protein
MSKKSFGRIPLRRHHADPRRRARTRFGADEDFDVLIQRVEQRYQSFYRETLELVVTQRRDLGLIEAEPGRSRGLGQTPLIQDGVERVSKPELGLPRFGVRKPRSANTLPLPRVISPAFALLALALAMTGLIILPRDVQPTRIERVQHIDDVPEAHRVDGAVSVAVEIVDHLQHTRPSCEGVFEANAFYISLHASHYPVTFHQLAFQPPGHFVRKS